MLEFKNLTCGYRGGFTLRDVDLAVDAGELVGIIGPNGSGKTTLLRAATRGLRPRSGQVLVDGEDIWHTRINALARKTAVVPQHPGDLEMTVAEYVLLGRIPHYRRFQFLETRDDWTVAERAMAQTDCLGLRDYSMNAISGGERQLALVARALAQEPRLLLLDEPTSSLDIAHVVRVLDLVRRLNRELGLTVVMVLHDLNAAIEYCSRLVLMNEGRIHKAGPVDDVIDYRTLEEVYKTVLVVGRNSISNKPWVLPVSEEFRGQGEPGEEVPKGRKTDAAGQDLHANG